MSGCKNLSVEEIFSSLFTQERFYSPTHIPHFLQTFAPPQVQKLSRDVQTLALLQGATLLASVAPNPVPLFDLPPLPNEHDNRGSKGSEPYIPFVKPQGHHPDSITVAKLSAGVNTSNTQVSSTLSGTKEQSCSKNPTVTPSAAVDPSCNKSAGASESVEALGNSESGVSGSDTSADTLADTSGADTSDYSASGTTNTAGATGATNLSESLVGSIRSDAVGKPGSSELSSTSTTVFDGSSMELKSDGSGVISGSLHDDSASAVSNSASAEAAPAENTRPPSIDESISSTKKPRRCQVLGNCPFEQHKNGQADSSCDFYSEDGCTCAQAWDITSDKEKCVEAVLPNVSRKVWTGAEFEDARAAVRYGLDEDRLKITLSSPLRHLQHKTLLFPLDVKASVRSRLTHCYEVSLYSKLCVSALVERMPRLRPLMYEMMVCTENSAMLHDIGRPPVGKFGEKIIRKWINEICELYDHELTTLQQDDLRAFNGLAQGLRLVHSIYKLNLSLGQLSAMIKCTKTYDELRQSGVPDRNAREMAGLFISELPLRERIRKSGFTFKRHPLSWLLEQCDDLASVLGNIEDAYDRGLMRGNEILELIENLIVYLKDNACNSTCDRCISACTCANGSAYLYRRGDSGISPMEIMDSPLASNSDIAHASEKGHNYGYGVDPSERDKLNMSAANTNQASCAKNGPATGQTSGKDQGKGYAGRQANNQQGNFVLGGEHDDVLAGGLTYIKLDVVLVDAIKHSYCKGKQDSFGVLQLVHGTNPISLSEMMRELGARTMLAIVRECIVTYYVDDIVNAICANQYNFFMKGELNVTHYGNDAHKAIDFLKRFEDQVIYNHEDIEALELSGGHYLRFVLKEYSKILSLSTSEFLACLTKNKGDAEVQKLCRRIPRRCREAYLDLCRKDMNVERYARIRLVLDFISFMTDPYLANEYEVLSGNSCRHLL